MAVQTARAVRSEGRKRGERGRRGREERASRGRRKERGGGRRGSASESHHAGTRSDRRRLCLIHI
eukprot:2137789-Rhodomonas_salina.1